MIGKPIEIVTSKPIGTLSLKEVEHHLYMRQIINHW